MYKWIDLLISVNKINCNSQFGYHIHVLSFVIRDVDIFKTINCKKCLGIKIYSDDQFRNQRKWYSWYWYQIIPYIIQEDSTECLLMLINIIHNGSMPDSSSTTSLTGASLSDILFSFVLEKYIVCDVCGLRSPSFESSSVLYISPTDTSSMQNLILGGLQKKLQKSCFWRN